MAGAAAASYDDPIGTWCLKPVCDFRGIHTSGANKNIRISGIYKPKLGRRSRMGLVVRGPHVHIDNAEQEPN